MYFESLLNERAAVVLLIVAGAGLIGLAGLVRARRWAVTVAALLAIAVPAMMTFAVLLKTDACGSFARCAPIAGTAAVATYLFEAFALFSLLGAAKRSRRVTRDGILEPLRLSGPVGRGLRYDRGHARTMGASIAAVGVILVSTALATGDSIYDAGLPWLELGVYVLGYIILLLGLYIAVLLGYLAVDLIDDSALR